MSKPHDTTLGYLPDTDDKKVTAPTKPRLVTTAHYSDTGESYLAHGLTPERVTTILRLADSGYPAHMLMAFEDVLGRDLHLRGLWDTALDEVCVDYQLLAGGADDASELARDLYAEATLALDHSDMIEHLANAKFKGFAFVEVAWVTRSVQGRLLQVPAELVCVPEVRFLFDAEGRPKLTSDAHPEGQLLQRSDGSSWIKATMARHRKPTKAGLLRVALWATLFKSMSIRDWIVMLGKHGIPMVIGKYTDEQGAKSREALREAIKQLGVEGWALLESDAVIEVLDNVIRSGIGAAELHGAMVALMNAEMSKLISGGTLTSEVTGPGSFASAKVQAERGEKRTLADANRIARWTRRGLGAEFLRRNQLAGAPFAITPNVKREALVLDAQIVEGMSRIGMDLSKRQVREKFSLAAPRDDADKLTPPVSKSPPPEKPKDD